MPPAPPPPSRPQPTPPQSNVGKILLFVGIGVVCLSCLVCGGIGALGLLGYTAAAPSVQVPPTITPSAAAPTAFPDQPEAPDDFVYTAPNGTKFIPDLAIAARGTVVTLAGTWRDDRRGFLLVLADDHSYRCQNGDPAAGNAAADTTEFGTWSLLAGKLHLVPTRLRLVASVGTRQIAEDHPAGPPRDLAIEGLALQYVPYNTPGASPRKLDGLALEGDAPAWDYTLTGKWKFTLRRAH